MTLTAEKENCLKKIKTLIFIVVILWILVISIPFLLIVLVVIFLTTGIDVKRILKKYWVYDCIKEYSSKTEKRKKIFTNIEKRYEKILSKREPKSKITYNYKTDYEKKIEEKNNTNNSDSYLNHKSIWDDYESVLDKFNK